MKTRLLGRTGRRLSVLGFGGIVVRDVTPGEAARHVGRAIDQGIDYFDVAPGYGNAEERLGPALAPYRDRVFLACKTGHREGGEAENDLHRSLKRLQTDHLDLYQFHAVSTVEQAERILAPGGALETFVAARERGWIRHIGFSAHSEEAALRLLDAYSFDSVLLPVNVFCWRDGAFGPRVCEKAREQGIGILAIKALAKRPLKDGEERPWPKCWYVPIDTEPEARAALSFTLSRPVVSAVSPGHAELLWLACDALKAMEDGLTEGRPETDLVGTPLFSAPAA